MSRRRQLRSVCLVGGNHRDITPGLEPHWHLSQDRSDGCAVPKGAAVVFILTRFVSHVVTKPALAQARAAGIPVVMVNGGKSALKREMLAWLEGRAPVGYRVLKNTTT